LKDSPAELAALEAKLAHTFKNPALLEQALTHPSATPSGSEMANNQRLEYLGDSVLDLIMAEELYARFPEDREGRLATYRASLVCGEFLTGLAVRLGLPEFLILSTAEAENGGRQRPSTLEDALEAVIGALYLDAGLEKTRQTVLAWYGDLDTLIESSLVEANPKGTLNEIAQRLYGNNTVSYDLIQREGKPPKERFVVQVSTQGNPLATGEGTSRKEAEEAAARQALKTFSEDKA